MLAPVVPATLNARPARVAVYRSEDPGFSVTGALAAVLGIRAREIELRRDGRGKPHLSRPAVDLRFSVSHTRGTTLLALAHGTDVGVDVEHSDRDVAGWALWSHVLTPAEAARVPAARGARNGSLLRAWVAKEAVLKAAGVGLGIDPREVEIDAAGSIAALPPSLGAPAEWALVALDLDGLTAALACAPSRGGAAAAR